MTIPLRMSLWVIPAGVVGAGVAWGLFDSPPALTAGWGVGLRVEGGGGIHLLLACAKKKKN